MKVVRSERVHNGMNFVDLMLDSKVDATVCLNDKRVVVVGNPQITIASGSSKFPDQVIFGLFRSSDDEVAIEERTSSKWERVEINLPREEGLFLLRLALKECGE